MNEGKPQNLNKPPLDETIGKKAKEAEIFLRVMKNGGVPDGILSDNELKVYDDAMKKVKTEREHPVDQIATSPVEFSAAEDENLIDFRKEAEEVDYESLSEHEKQVYDTKKWGAQRAHELAKERREEASDKTG